MKTIRCSDCAAEFTDDELDAHGARSCPTCGTTSVPCAIANDVSLRINWHELRIITIWASNYAAEKMRGHASERTLKSIIGRLEAQFPEKSPLTLAGEFKQLAAIGDIEVHQGGEVTKIPHRKPD